MVSNNSVFNRRYSSCALCEGKVMAERVLCAHIITGCIKTYTHQNRELLLCWSYAGICACRSTSIYVKIIMLATGGLSWARRIWASGRGLGRACSPLRACSAPRASALLPINRKWLALLSVYSAALNSFGKVWCPMLFWKLVFFFYIVRIAHTL